MKDEYCRRLRVAAALLFLLALTAVADESAAQSTVDNLLETYLVSVLHPEAFDSYVEANRTYFQSAQVRQHLICVQQRMMQQAQYEIAQCQALADPNARYQCTQNNTGAAMFFWVSSLMAAVEGTPWSETWTGGTMIWANEFLQQSGVDLEAMMQQFWPIIEPMMRAHLAC